MRFKEDPHLFLPLAVVPVFEQLITTGPDTEFDPTLKWEINCTHSRQPELPLQNSGNFVDPVDVLRLAANSLV